MNSLTINKEIKIRDVKKIWEEANKSESHLNIDCKNLENFDGAGFQFLIYFLNLEKENSEKYTISGISENVKNSLASFGYILDKGEKKK